METPQDVQDPTLQEHRKFNGNCEEICGLCSGLRTPDHLVGVAGKEGVARAAGKKTQR